MPNEIESVVLKNRLVCKDTYSLWFYAPAIARCAQPGQFVMLGVDGKFLRRPLSIAGTNGGRIMLLVRIAGEGTQSIAELRRNRKVPMLGPLGNGFPMDIDEPMLVGGGIGIAPLLFAAWKMAGMNKNYSLFYGEKSAENLIRSDLLPEETHIATDDGDRGFHGTVIEMMNEFVPGSIMACGPEPMLRCIAEKAKKDHLKAWLSLEARMACGFGVCQGCVIDTKHGYKRVCSDGPVFPADELWD